MNKKELAAAMRLMKRIEKTRIKIAALRDKLRSDISDIEATLDSLDTGIEELELGCQYLNDGLDELSLTL